MKYDRLYADENGETHFQKAEIDLEEADYRPPAPLLFVSHAKEASAVQFVRLPAGWDGRNITPPQAQYLICLEGQLELTSSGGAKRTLVPGQTVLMEDTSGKGHRTRWWARETASRQWWPSLSASLAHSAIFRQLRPLRAVLRAHGHTASGAV